MKQTLSQKKAEIIFRSVLAQQHLTNTTHFPNEYSQHEVRQEFEKRVLSTTADFKLLKKLHIPFAQFVEIGAEYCFRSALLTSKFKARGVALDISSASLESAPYFAKVFKLRKLPTRICADAHALPFIDNCVPFLFSYQTIHHFPDPLPVIDEIRRVLRPGGYFYMREEPIKQLLNLRLFRRPTKQTGILKILRTLYILPFISDIGKTETDYGIVEESFTLKIWSKIISKFDTVEVEIKPLFGRIFKTTDKKLPIPLTTRILLALFGGGITFLAQKYQEKIPLSKSKELFECPLCKKNLRLKNKTTQCSTCRSSFIYRKGIHYLLTPQIYKSLYERE